MPPAVWETVTVAAAAGEVEEDECEEHEGEEGEGEEHEGEEDEGEEEHRQRAAESTSSWNF